ncbi:AAA family ATPase [Proteus sp. fly-1008]|uniref:ATP-dependent nuclease n=1 Tax=Proteus sp. fly-1008 TaxID=3136672 RepID=UPI0032DBCAF2|nr:AAA family ATPase [Proteus hauseri]
MEKSIVINNIKNIKTLSFSLPPTGVYILTGKNGTGKTTLLTALHRIGFSNAFANSFKTTNNSNKIDNYQNASIIYNVMDKSVSYSYGNTRWAPTPRKNSTILSEFEYPEVRFIAADSKRIEATNDELKEKNILPVSAEINKEMVNILLNDKFDSLCYVNTKRGKGSRAYLIKHKTAARKTIYYSEKNFSLGELCILRLLVNLNEIKDNSLVLIDEVEMALHPQAQLALYEYLKNIAKKKSLTIIFSTHSVSLIKTASRDNILLLLNDGLNNVRCESKVYPAQALGELAYQDEIQPDFIFFVEDKMALLLLTSMIEKHKIISFATRPVPTYKIVPIGGFKQVIEFISDSNFILSSNIKTYAFLDEDVKSESIVEAQQNKKYKFLELVEKNEEKIKYLPCTPELGLMQFLLKDPINHQKKLEEKNSGIKFELNRIFSLTEFRKIEGDKPRDVAKNQLAFLIDDLKSKVKMHDENIINMLFEHYVHYFYSDSEFKNLKNLFGPILK